MAAPVVTCTCDVCSRARKTIRRILDVLDVYGWLLDSYIVDFFQEQSWERLPNSWRLVLQAASPEEFGKWLGGDISCARVWPLSLLALRQTTKNLQIDRDHRNDKSILQCDKAKKSEWNTKSTIVETEDRISHSLHDVLKKHNNLFLKHVKIKKRHEIEQIAQVCADCAQESNVKCVVDVGAGIGHLARSLAFKYGLCVICIEQNYVLLEQARKWDRELLVSMSKHLSGMPMNLPQHMSVKLENTNSDRTETVNDIQEIFSNNFSSTGKDIGFGIVGLHPCGDLAATLLRFYVTQREARFICIVGCCYMKLTLQDSTERSGYLNGYPLSQYLSSFVNHKLSYIALEVACHAIENYCDKLKTGNCTDLIVHAYRAILETILIKRDKRLRHTQVRSVKVAKFTTFQQYCKVATENLESHFQLNDSDFQDPQIKYFLNQWQRVVIFGALRTMLAPLVETMVLLDRYLFLSENDLPPTLKPIFDARLSPRNLLLFSVRSNKE